MATYDSPGITYDGTPTDVSFVTALDRLEQLWRHMELDTLAPGGFTKEGIASAVVSALQATTIPVDTKKMNGADIVGDGSEANPWRGVGVQP